MLDLVLIVVFLSLSYLWVAIPELRELSLQLTAALFVVYFVSKRLSGSRWHHILPKPASIETALLTGAVALVVGSTGSLQSPFLPLFHLILFISVLTIDLPANIAKVIGLTVFLWATSIQPFTNAMWIELLSLPFLMPLMIFARLQFEEAQEEKHLIKLEENILQEQEQRILLFLATYLRPKLNYIRQLLRVTQDNRLAVDRQLETLEQDIIKLTQEIDHASDSLDLPNKS